MSLFDDIEPVAAPPARPAPTSGTPAWSPYKNLTPIQCDSCISIAMELGRLGHSYPPVRRAKEVRRSGNCKASCRTNVRRLGFGCDHLRHLCRDHADQQRLIDQAGAA